MGALSPVKLREVSIDEMLPYVGEFGRFQKTTVFVMFLTYFTLGYQVLIVYFTTMVPTWKCQSRNMTTTCSLNGTLPSDDRRRCNMSLDDWEYTEPSEFSLATQFRIGCDDEWKLELTSSAFFVGWGIGSFIYGYLGDKFGRKVLIAPSMAGVLGFAFASAFMPNIYLVMVCRFFIGIVVLGPIVQLGTLVMELVGSKHRPLSGLIPMMSFPFAYSLLALKSYMLRNWRYLSIVTTAPYMWLLFLYLLLPESVRWLQLKGHHKEVMEIFRTIAKRNNRRLPSHITVIKVASDKASKESGNLFQSRKMGLRTLSCAMLWFSSSMTFYSLQLAANDLSGDVYKDFIYLSLIQLPGVLINLGMMNKWGRKVANLGPLFIAGTACVVVGFIPKTGVMRYVRVGLGMFGKCMATATFEGISVWSNEVFPTSIRMKGIGFVQVAARIGASSAPFIGKGLKPFGLSIPFVVMGIPSVVASITGLYLPETQNMSMIESVEDVEKEVKNNDTDKDIEMGKVSDGVIENGHVIKTNDIIGNGHVVTKGTALDHEDMICNCHVDLTDAEVVTNGHLPCTDNVINQSTASEEFETSDKSSNTEEQPDEMVGNITKAAECENMAKCDELDIPVEHDRSKPEESIENKTIENNDVGDDKLSSKEDENDSSSEFGRLVRKRSSTTRNVEEAISVSRVPDELRTVAETTWF